MPEDREKKARRRPALRDEPRADLKGLAADTLAKQRAASGAGSIATGPITLLVPALVDRIVDADVNPDGLVRVINDQNAPNSKRSDLANWIVYSFFESPMEFRDLQNPSRSDGPKVTALLDGV